MPDTTAPSEFTLDISPSGGAVVITVTGEVDMGTSPRVWDAILSRSSSPPEVVLDLAGVSFLDSAGLAVLIRGHHHMTAQGGRLVLRNVSRPVGRTIDIAGLTKLLPVDGRVMT
jgi:anti-anti-sigma factor